MMAILIRFLVCAAGLWIASRLLGGVSFTSAQSLVIAAIVLGLANAFLRPVLQIIALPVTLLTLGVFALVVNGIVVALVDALLAGFRTASFWDDLLIALIVGLVGWGVNLFGPDRKAKR